MMPLGPWELVIILLICVIIFGAGRLSEIGGAFGRSVREFRNATRDEPEPPASQPTTAQSTTSQSANSAGPVAPTAAETRYCGQCGAQNRAEQTFCSQCGTRLKVAV